ncbi:hypothetical protein JX265_010373 [Neoarthrinium moseri]|uniref:AMP-dependent synthetase/ligase domain-containing protein n=1 Tax=Neoarthrinium moseri TaxID=1658444 RepID=A0A9Q0ALS3_9PEZI|nr:hypothetical protein JX265_010373 [Neoarthrinium moseri]
MTPDGTEKPSSGKEHSGFFGLKWQAYQENPRLAAEIAWTLLLTRYGSPDVVNLRTATLPAQTLGWTEIPAIHSTSITLNENTQIQDIESQLNQERLTVEVPSSGDSSLVLFCHDYANAVESYASLHKDHGPQDSAVLRLLSQVTAEQSSVRVQDLEMMSESDLRDVWSWNATVTETVEACIHDLISQTVRRQPDAPAVCAWDGELTYAELDERSTWLAHHLTGPGVGPGIIVPICFEKSMWTPVAVLGVMKAGAASITLDITVPEARLPSTIGQVNPTFALASTEQTQLARRMLDHGSIITVDCTLFDSLVLNPRWVQPAVKPEDRICVFFTSGSTGSPKAIGITHSGFASSVKYQTAAFGIDETSRLFDFASYSFDISWFNFVHALTNGGCLCVPSEFDRKNDLNGSMRRLQSTFAFLTPSVARTLHASDIPSLQMVALGGEAQRISDLLPGARKQKR